MLKAFLLILNSIKIKIVLVYTEFYDTSFVTIFRKVVIAFSENRIISPISELKCSGSRFSSSRFSSSRFSSSRFFELAFFELAFFELEFFELAFFELAF